MISAFRLDQETERAALGGARAVAGQGVDQHGGELRFGIKDDGDAADDTAALRVGDRRAVDVSRPTLIQMRRAERRHRIGLVAAQRQNARDPFFVERRAFEVAAVFGRNRDDASLVIEDDQIRIDGVEPVDRLQNGADRLPVRLGERRCRQKLGESRRQGPPPAIVGALVEIAVHDVDGEGRMKLIVMQERRHDRLVQIGDRALKDVLGLGAGIADFGEQRFRESRRIGPRAALCGLLLLEIAVPHRAVQFALNMLGLGGNGAHVVVEQFGRMDDALDHRRIDAGKHFRRARGEGMRQRHHHVAVPARTAIALIGLRRSRDGEVFHGSEADDAIFGVEHRLELGAERNMKLVGGGKHGAGLVENGDDGPVLLADQIGENQLGFVLEAKAQAHHAEQSAVMIGHAVGIDQRPLLSAHEIAGAKALDIGRRRFDGGADRRIGARCDADAVVVTRQHIALRIEHDDIGIDRVFADILAEAFAERRKFFALAARVAQEGADVVVAR